MTAQSPRVLVIGLGNEHRGDDAAGLIVVRRLHPTAAAAGVEVREHRGEPTDLIEGWRGREGVVIVDTMCSEAAPGSIRRFDASAWPLPSLSPQRTSTHALSLDAAIELGRVLTQLPARLIVYGIEGRSFAPGSHISKQLSAAIPRLTETVLREATTLAAQARRAHNELRPRAPAPKSRFCRTTHGADTGYDHAPPGGHC